MPETVTLSTSQAARLPQNTTRPSVAFSHLTSALIAVVIFLAALFAAESYAVSIENYYLHALAPLKVPEKIVGAALERAAFQQSDLLPVYGASEIRTGRAFRPDSIFAKYPTGFQVFTVAKPRANSLIIMQKLAAVGAAARGKKVVIFTSPDYYIDPMIPVYAYDGNYSALHGNELVFSTDLSYGLKQRAAQRMLDYPNTLSRDRLLGFAVHELANASITSEALYYAALPLGKLHAFILGLQDHWATLQYIRASPELNPNITREPAELDWSALRAAGQQDHRLKSGNNSYGIEDQYWDQYLPTWANARNTLSDEKYRDLLQNSKEWIDLDLLLQELKELGAKPLLLSLPIHARYYAYQGISAAGQQLYFQKLHALSQANGVPEIDFAEHDQDRDFFADAWSHPSSMGWVYYDEVLDNFYHGTLDATPRLGNK